MVGPQVLPPSQGLDTVRWHNSSPSFGSEHYGSLNAVTLDRTLRRLTYNGLFQLQSVREWATSRWIGHSSSHSARLAGSSWRVGVT
jgi:hypothetical protein